MIELERFKQEQEARRNRNWKKLSARQRYWTLKYVYILHTDFENRFDYIEFYRFLEMKICLTNLPDFTRSASLKEIYEEAHIVLGLPTPKDIA